MRTEDEELARQARRYTRDEVKGPAWLAIGFGILLLLCGLPLLLISVIEMTAGRTHPFVIGFGLVSLLTGLFAFYMAWNLFQRTK